QHLAEGVGVVDLDLVDGGDHIAGLDSGGLGRSLGDESADQAADRDATEGGVGTGHLQRFDAQVRYHQRAVADDLLYLRTNVGRADGEPHRLAVRVRFDVDPDDLARHVEQRSAGASRVGLDVRLDGVGDGQRARRNDRVGDGDRLVQGADDPSAGRAEAERGPDCHDGFADLEGGRVAEGEG